MFSGGQNTQIKLLNEKNQLLIKNFIGVYFFLQYFYWYPLVNFLSLSFESEYLAVVDQNLELVQGTKIAYEKEQKQNDYFEYKEQDVKKEDKKKVVLSMNKKQQKQEVNTTEMEIQETIAIDFSLQNP